jgi:hypothetical protein
MEIWQPIILHQEVIMRVIKTKPKFSFFTLINLFIIISFFINSASAAPKSVQASSPLQEDDLNPLTIAQGSTMQYFLMGQKELTFTVDVQSPRTGEQYYWSLQHPPTFGRVTIQSMGNHAQVTYLPTANASGNDFFNLLLTASTGESANTAVIITLGQQPSIPTQLAPVIGLNELRVGNREIPAKQEPRRTMPRELTTIKETRDDPVSPVISVNYSDDYIQGSNFLPTDDVLLTIFVDDTLVYSNNEYFIDEYGVIFFQIDSFDVQPGQTVILTDGTHTQSHIVADLSISEIDLGSKTISGLTDGDINNLEVSAFDGANWCLQNEPLAGVVPNSWTANFTSCEHTVTFAPGTDGWAYQYDNYGNFTQEYWSITAPNLGVDVSHDFIMGFNFLPNKAITLSILSEELVIVEYSDEWGFVSFQLDPGIVQPGQTVVMTDGTDTQTYVVADVSISEIDKDTKTVSGLTDGDINNLEVSASSDGENWCNQWAVGDGEPGAWTAVFSDCGGVTFELGTEGWATQYDEHDNFTQKYWDFRLPYVGVNYSDHYNNIEGYGFSPHVSVTLNMLGSEWEGLSEWSDDDGNVFFYIDPSVIDIQPGQTFILEDSNEHRVEYTVSDLSDIEIYEATKTVTGRTDGKLRTLMVSAFDGEVYCEWWGPDSDEPGAWSADFSACDPAVAFEPLTDGWAFQYDDDGNFTQVYWQIPAPQIGVFHSADFLGVDGWPPNAEVTLKIGSYRWETTAGDQGTVSFHLDPFNVQPGQTITVTDGDQTQSYDVANLTVINIDETNHIVSGSKSPNLPLVVTGGGEGSECYYDLGSDESEYWEVDFSECIEITPGTFGWVFQLDQRGHHLTQEFWIVPAPKIGIYPAANYIQGADLTANTEITLTIDSQTWTAKSDKDGVAAFDLHPFNVQTGDEVTISDGLYTQSYVAANVAVTGIDVDSNTVSGTRSWDQGLYVNAMNNDDFCEGGIDAYHEEGDDWAFYFSNCDISEGASGWAVQEDERGNVTQDFWFVPDPRLTVYPLSGWVVGGQWPPNTEISLSIGGSEWQERSNNEGSVYFDTGSDVLVPGHPVSMTGGGYTQLHEIIDLNISGITNNTISGTANPGEVVTIAGTSVGFTQMEIDVTTDSSGNWVADFPGLSPGSYGYAWQKDDNGNATSINWYVPAPAIDVFIETSIITGTLWPQNANVTLTINDNEWHAQSDVFGFVFFDITPFELLPEHLIIMSDDIDTIEYQPWQITITEINTETDVIRGSAQFSGISARSDQNEIEVRACNTDGCLSQYLTLDGSGNWEASFNGVLNIGPGNSGHIKSEDGTKGRTKLDWTISDEGSDFPYSLLFPLFVN